MHFLIAPNAFKNSINAMDAAVAIGKGLEQSRLNASYDLFPIGDGGDGTAALIIHHCGGKSVPCAVHDPLGRLIESRFGWVEETKTAVIELADVSGLRLLVPGEYNPLHYTTFGTGELIRSALDRSPRELVLGIGGSATVDGGVGILQALGIRLLNAKKEIIVNLPLGLSELESIDVSELDSRILKTNLVVLCDVSNFLLGEKGAAAVFGPQKGAKTSDIKILDAGLSKLREKAIEVMKVDMNAALYGGAAGGVAAGLYAFLHARLVSGIEYFLDITGFDKQLEKAEMVITAEGSLDEQTLQGKGPFGVARRAKEKDIPVVAMAGKIPSVIPGDLRKYFDYILSINDGPVDPVQALKSTAENLTRTSRHFANELFANQEPKKNDS